MRARWLMLTLLLLSVFATWPAWARVSYLVLFPSGTRTASTAGPAVDLDERWRGLICFLNVSAAAGTGPTLSVAIQRQDPVSGNWTDINGAGFALMTGVGFVDLTLYPGVNSVANETVSTAVGGRIRAFATIAGTAPSFTFSVSCVPLL